MLFLLFCLERERGKLMITIDDNNKQLYYELKKNKHLILNYDTINKKILYVHYQGKYKEVGVFDCPHILVLGNDKFKKSFDKTKMENLLGNFIKTSF